MNEESLRNSHGRLEERAIKAMPKIDLHRHLEGSLRPQTLLEVAREFKLDIPARNLNQLRPYIQITDDPPDYEVFLAKFEVLRHFYQSPEIIKRVAYESVEDAANDNVHYLELRFSPQALSRVGGFALEDVTDWVIDATQRASMDLEIGVRLIVTLVRHEPVEKASQVAEIAFERFADGITGIDLAGNEVKFPPKPFRPIFERAKSIGLGVTIHAGEWASADGVLQAVEELHADRIGHGVRAIENSEVLKMVRERQIALEVCLTSNVQTGVVRSLPRHPLPTLLRLDMPATLNTDDPGVSDCTLSDEYQAAVEELKLSYAELRRMILNAAAAAFLPEEQRRRLVMHFEERLPSNLGVNGHFSQIRKNPILSGPA